MTTKLPQRTPNQTGEDRKIDEAARSQGEEIKQLAEESSAKAPELDFSPAEILLFRLKYRQSPEAALDHIEAQIVRIREEMEGGE
jgi:hypothetical protein